MAKRQKEPEKPPSKAYLLSFGDTMTTLLAFFIILVSLAEDQTGVNLYRGTGSFVNAMDGLGLPGLFSEAYSSRTFQSDDSSPLYMADDPEEQSEKNPSGPDDTPNEERVVDRELDQFKRFLNEIERRAEVEADPETTSEIVFDFFERLNEEPPCLPRSYDAALAQVFPLFRSPSHRIDVIVWATSPKPSAWERAARQAAAIRQEIAELAQLEPTRQLNLKALAKPWHYSDAKRPVVSIAVRKITARSPK